MVPDDVASTPRRQQLLNRWIEEERVAIAEAEDAEAELVFAIDSARFEAEQSGTAATLADELACENDPWGERWHRLKESGTPEQQHLWAELVDRRQVSAITLARLRSMQLLNAICRADGRRNSRSGDAVLTKCEFPASEAALSLELQSSLASLLPLLRVSSVGIVPGSDRGENASSAGSESRWLLTAGVRSAETNCNLVPPARENVASADVQFRDRASAADANIHRGADAAEEIFMLRRELAETYEHIAALESKTQKLSADKL